MKTSRKIVVTAALFCLLVALIIGVFVFKLVNWHIAKNDFYHAIENNDIDNVRILLEEYPSLANSTRDPILGFLLQLFMDYRESNALICALHSHADLEMIKLLVGSGVDVNKHPFGNNKDFPILLALRLGEYETALYFIDEGADLHIRTQTETAPYNLLYSSDREGVDKKLQYQLFLCMMEQEVCLDPPAKGDFEGKPFLHMACKNADILEALFAISGFEVDINAINNIDSVKVTALMITVCRQDYEACELLLAHGADTKIKDQYGKTAYDYALELEDQILIEMLSK